MYFHFVRFVCVRARLILCVCVCARRQQRKLWALVSHQRWLVIFYRKVIFFPEKWRSDFLSGNVIFIENFLNASDKARVGKITFLNATDCRENKQTRGLILVILAIDLG